MLERSFEQFLSRPEEERKSRLTILEEKRCEILNRLAEMEAKKELLGNLCPDQEKEQASLKKKIEALIGEMRELGANWV